MIILSILIFIVAMAIPSINRHLSSILFTRMGTIILIFSGALALNAFYIQSIGSGIGVFSGLFQVTTISQQLDIFLLIIGALILIPRPAVLLANKSLLSSRLNTVVKTMPISEIASGLGGKYSLVVLFSTLGSLLLISSSDLLSMYLSIELQSFGVYILSTLFRDSKPATSAGLKYFLLGGLSSCIILLGSALVYTFTGLSNLESIYTLLSVSDSSAVSQGLTLGIILIVIGFLFKIAAAPLHNWAPDVYNDSPSIVTIWLTIMPKISILIFLLDIYMGSSLSINNLSLLNSSSSLLISGDLLKNLLLLTSLLSLIIGSVVGLAQSKIKRLLAYSTISHIGFILLALSINSEQSIESFIFYIMQYSITNLNTFLIILALGYLIKKISLIKNNNPNEIGIEESDISLISELKGLFYSQPLLSLGLTICILSMAGTPPLLGFFSKQMVLYSAIQSGYYFMSIIAIIMSVISASYYLKIVLTLYTEPENLDGSINEVSVGAPSPLLGDGDLKSIEINTKDLRPYDITSVHSYLISTLSLFILLFILKPSILLNSSQLLSLSIFQC